MAPFVYTALPYRVVFGLGALDHLPREIDLLGVQRALVLSTPEQKAQADDVARRLGARCVGTFPRAVMHVPIETAREARAEAKRLGADCAVAVGGGSTTGLGKAIALESALPILAIPTTYAGSEMTPIYGITEGGLKKTGRDARVLPKTVIYDPTLTVGLPVGLSATSGMNAIAHAVEGLYAQDANPIMTMMAEEGIRALAQGLPRVKRNPEDLEANIYMAVLHLAAGDKGAAAWKADEIRVLQPGFSSRRWLETHPLTDPSQKRKLVQALGELGL